MERVERLNDGHALGCGGAVGGQHQFAKVRA